MSEQQQQTNRAISKVRARIEHVFGAQAAMGGYLVSTIGLQRAKVMTKSNQKNAPGTTN